MSVLKQTLSKTKPREDSGAPTNARYHFQALCGLVLVLERHKLDGNYALVFEFHDDIAIFDDPVDPQSVRFYQVKTKKIGHWTPASLTKRETEKGKESSSHLGKMYQNIIAFDGSVKSCTFLSNASTNFAPNDNQKFCLTECSKSDLESMSEKLAKEFSGEAKIKSQLLWIEKSDLSLDDADTHAKGKLEAFIVDNLGEVEFSLTALFKTVSDECTRKARATKVDLEDYENVVARRGITRQDTNSWLYTVSSTVACPKWEEITSEINLPAGQKLSLRREWNRYRVSVLNPNEAVRKVRRMIASKVHALREDEIDINTMLSSVFNELRENARTELNTESDELIKAMILYEAYSF